MEAAATRPRYGEGRQALLDAAIRVVAAKGLRGLTLREVGAQAGVTHGLVRHHFGTRAALLEAAVEYAVEQSLATTTLEPESRRIEDFAAHLGEEIEGQAGRQAFQFEVLLEARRSPDLLPEMRRAYDEYLETAARGLHAAGLEADPDLEHLVFAALDGLVLQQIAFGHPERTDAAIARLQDLLRAWRAADGEP